ncbi:MAG: hypothetical protein ACI9WU_004891, partial [Myxococcota bacterium]
MSATEHPRRAFLKQSAAVATGALAVSATAGLIEPQAAWATRLRETGRGKIAGVEHSGAMKSLHKENGAIVEKMTNAAILRFTGKRTVARAYKEFVSAKDIVGLKLNCLASPKMGTSNAMVDAIVKGLQAVGIPNEHIILYEQYEGRLTARGSGYALNDDPKKGPLVLHMGGKKIITDKGLQGYQSRKDKHASGPSHFGNILKYCTAIINAPVIKDHSLSGVTVGMKNM